MDIYVSMSFDAAHRLPEVPAGHRCGNLHGHTFLVEIHIQGPVSGRTGWVIDFGDIKAAAKPYIDQLDHTYLNEVEGLENPTSENIAIWIWDKLSPHIEGLAKIVVKESPTSGAAYRGR